MTKRIWKTIKYFLINGSFAACIYFWLFKEHNGAGNVSVFYIWFSFIVSLTCLMESVQESLAKKQPMKSVPIWFDRLFDLSIAALLVYFGHFVLGTAYLIHFYFLWHCIEKVKEIREKNNE